MHKTYDVIGELFFFLQGNISSEDLEGKIEAVSSIRFPVCLKESLLNISKKDHYIRGFNNGKKDKIRIDNKTEYSLEGRGSPFSIDEHMITMKGPIGIFYNLDDLDISRYNSFQDGHPSLKTFNRVVDNEINLLFHFSGEELRIYMPLMMNKLYMLTDEEKDCGQYDTTFLLRTKETDPSIARNKRDFGLQKLHRSSEVSDIIEKVSCVKNIKRLDFCNEDYNAQVFYVPLRIDYC